MEIWDREKKELIEEKEYGSEKLSFLYNTLIGRILLKFIFANRWYSKLNSLYQKSKFSKNKIKNFIKEYKIKMDDYKKIEEYISFEDFFVRKRDVKKDINQEVYNKENLIAIADSKLKIVFLDENCIFEVKHCKYNLKNFILDKKIYNDFRNGICLIYRLTIDDYHRYVFLDNGFLKKEYHIKGKLHTVQPISHKYKTYINNSREVNILSTENFGDVIQVEVGAMLVGKINNNRIKKFSRLDEKGYFDFGGSTIVQIFKNNVISIDEDILHNSKNNIETKVKIGMIIGKKIIMETAKKSTLS